MKELKELIEEHKTRQFQILNIVDTFKSLVDKLTYIEYVYIGYTDLENDLSFKPENLDDIREHLIFLMDLVMDIEVKFKGFNSDYVEVIENDPKLLKEFTKDNPVYLFLIDTKIRIFGAEIMQENGIEIVDLTENGFVIKDDFKEENILLN